MYDRKGLQDTGPLKRCPCGQFPFNRTSEAPSVQELQYIIPGSQMSGNENNKDKPILCSGNLSRSGSAALRTRCAGRGVLGRPLRPRRAPGVAWPKDECILCRKARRATNDDLVCCRRGPSPNQFLYLLLLRGLSGLHVVPFVSPATLLYPFSRVAPGLVPMAQRDTALREGSFGPSRYPLPATSLRQDPSSRVNGTKILAGQF